MKKTIHFTLLALLFLTVLCSCTSYPHRAEKLDTRMSVSEPVSGDLKIGVKKGDMVVQRKVYLSEELRFLQNGFYELEDRVYGNRKYGSLGLYGVLRDCQIKLADKVNGGNGTLGYIEPLDRVTDKEEELALGLDDSNRLIGVSEEYLKDRLQRFRGYKRILQSREDEYSERIAICQVKLKSQAYEAEKTARQETN